MFDFNKILKEIKKRKAKRILLQVPEGLKTKVVAFAEKLEKEGLTVLISCDPCYGACDVRDLEAEKLDCDLIVHFGHSDLGIATKIPVIYNECRFDMNPVPLLHKYLKILKPCKKVSLVTTVQYLSTLKPVKKFLEENKKKVYIGKPKKARHPGQVLGCDYSAALETKDKVDCFLFMGSGMFHPMGLALLVDKPVLSLNLEKKELVNIKKESEILKRIKLMQIETSKNLRSFGILVSTKYGQMNLETALKTKKMLEKKGKKASILVFDEITPEKILGMDFGCLINCACPRLIEDFRQFKKPILNPENVKNL